MSSKMGKKSRGMNPISKDKVKAEVKEKVREIRLRQEKWMKQREEHRGQTSSTSVSKQQDSPAVTETPVRLEKKAISDSHRDDLDSDQSCHGDGLTHSKSPADDFQPKGKFKSWLEARNSPPCNARGNEKGVRHSETVTHPDGRETNVLQLDSARSVECATPDPDWSRDQVLGPTSSRSDQTLNSVTDRSIRVQTGTRGSKDLRRTDFGLLPDQFETLADEIISRVRKDLDLKTGLPGKQVDHKSCEMGVSHGWADVPPKHNPVNTDINSRHLSSHNCPLCRKVMLSPDQTPMLLSPCGHGLCADCVKGRSLCPCCQTPVDSTVANLMLQQIITGFYQEKNNTKERVITREYEPSLYAEKNDLSYSEKYSNLKMRQEVLISEQSSVCQDLRSISEEIQKERKQLHNIEVAEVKLTAEIDKLERRLNDLRGHKEEYQVKVTELDKQNETMNKKRAMLEDTLRAVELEMEKVQLLAEETGR